MSINCDRSGGDGKGGLGRKNLDDSSNSGADSDGDVDSSDDELTPVKDQSIMSRMLHHSGTSPTLSSSQGVNNNPFYHGHHTQSAFKFGLNPLTSHHHHQSTPFVDHHLHQSHHSHSAPSLVMGAGGGGHPGHASAAEQAMMNHLSALSAASGIDYSSALSAAASASSIHPSNNLWNTDTPLMMVR